MAQTVRPLTIQKQGQITTPKIRMAGDTMTVRYQQQQQQQQQQQVRFLNLILIK